MTEFKPHFDHFDLDHRDTFFQCKVFKEGECDKESNVQKMHIPNSDKPSHRGDRYLGHAG